MRRLSVNFVLRFALWLSGLVFGVLAAGALALGLFALSLLPELPTVESFKDVPLKVPLRIYSRERGLIAEFGEERREPVGISEVPRPLINAVLAAEDDGFYRHPGIDVVGVARAALANLRARTREQGASTITMQVARNFFLSREKTYKRKLKEMLLAFRLEQVLSKDEILELYLNKIFLGHRAYGFAAAARAYYGKPLAELALSEMAMLAGLPKAPSRDNPLTDPDNARQRRNYVLDRMLKLDHITPEEHRQAAASRLTAARHTPELALNAPYVAELVRSYMLEAYGEQAYWGGYKVFTTVNERNQVAADRALRDGLLAYDRRHGFRGPIAQHPVSGATSSSDLDVILDDVFASHDILPAVVLATEKQQATAYTKTKDIVTLAWDGLSWASRFERPNKQGAKPKQASDILKPGDVVYVQKTDKDNWQLVQLPAVA
ncbi:MAG: transglycosylase domain-containing protein, partial [Gammaproteobacteria bacterium]|nr:transglycosylase domain-containing protein [Gammaproteobacteria bacterium]